MNGRIRETKFSRIVKSPETVLIGGFAGVILVGTLILLLPWAHQPGKVGLVDALFTSTSAVCVTGLAVVDTEKDFTVFGQVVIMLLIQTGGLGIMSFAALAFQIIGLRLSLQSRAILSDSFFQRDLAREFERSFRTILIITFGIEGLGAVLLWFFFLPRLDPGAAAFHAVFHSVSAFCNAGFSTFSQNLVEWKDSPGVLFVIMALIVFGGLGYMVLHEIWRFLTSGSVEVTSPVGRRFSLHTRVVLIFTPILIVGGTIFLLIFGLTAGEATWWDKTVHALFQSVTARTAGFNSTDIGRLPAASLFTLIMLMFIGGSPGSCAGGVKTTSLAVWLSLLVATIYGRREVRLLDRRISQGLVNRVNLLLGLSIFWNIVGILTLFSTESHLKVGALDLIFEQVSAFGTVGLSTGLTPDLSAAGKLWLSATMFVGRLGPLTVGLWMFPRQHTNLSYPKGSVMIG
jgi:trk system potassium uptake protein